jgi:hypothetical protein
MKDIPAFSRPASEAHQHGMHAPQEGMTLRDYFAAKAMQGQLSIFENVTALAREQIKLEDVCIASYEVADAMLKAREQ